MIEWCSLQAAQDVCMWVHGGSDCRAYRIAAIVNLVCSACDYSVTIFFALCAQVMEKSSTRLKRCELILHAD